MEDKKEEDKHIQIEDVEIGDLIASTHNGGTKVVRAYYDGFEYVLKIVERDSIETHLELEHLMNERDALRALSHPAINKIKDTLKDAKHLYFLLEIVYGIPLHELLRMRAKLTVPYAKLIIIQVIKAFEYMHSQGYIYRDLKASNLIVNEHGKLTIIDLGYIKKIGKERTNSFCGTIHMIAPELYCPNLEETGYSYEIDVYSIGILLYEIIVGSAPFGYDDATTKGKVTEGLNKEILEKVRFDNNLLDLVTKLLAKEAHQRPTITQLLAHPFFAGSDITAAEKIMKGEYSNVSEDIKRAFDVSLYEEDIEDFGIRPANQKLSEEERLLQDKFADAFGDF